MIKGVNFKDKQEYIVEFGVDNKAPQIRCDLMSNYKDCLFFVDCNRLYVFNMFTGAVQGLHDFSGKLNQNELVSCIQFQKASNKFVFMVETIEQVEGQQRETLLRIHRFVVRV
mmetsp:Transcript_42292/g.40513  ORF Transcript_42292/g.40513 Transcript_42292/m.40513 type:complete len:113 (+) Transcript_42292:735-1073(+)